MSQQEQVLEPVEVEVSTLQDRERRERLEPRPIERDAVVDWRSYARHDIPSRWRA